MVSELRRSGTVAVGSAARSSHARVLSVVIVSIAAAFSLFFFSSVLPALVPAAGLAKVALLDGLVNPTATGYTADAIATALVLLAWIAYERAARGVRHGWIAAVLCFVPGVAVGFAAYLLIRRFDRDPQTQG